MKGKNAIPHRERKNGASREQWEKRKAAANKARGAQNMFPHEVDGKLKVRRTRS